MTVSIYADPSAANGDDTAPTSTASPEAMGAATTIQEGTAN